MSRLPPANCLCHYLIPNKQTELKSYETEIKVKFMMFDATFKNISAISWWTVLPVATLSHNVVHLPMNGV